MTNINLLKSKQISLEFQANPKKFKKYHKIKYVNNCKDTSVKFKGISIILHKHRFLTPKQLLIILKLIKPELKRTGKTGRVHLPLKVDTILTKKPKDIRMGRGKGAPSEKVFAFKGGQNLFTIFGLSSIAGETLANLCLPKLDNSLKINRQK
jgi:large subunit ribosomal protein L16